MLLSSASGLVLSLATSGKKRKTPWGPNPKLRNDCGLAPRAPEIVEPPQWPRQRLLRDLEPRPRRLPDAATSLIPSFPFAPGRLCWRVGLAACTHHVDPVSTGGGGAGGGGGGGGWRRRRAVAAAPAACLSPRRCRRSRGCVRRGTVSCNDPEWVFCVTQACTSYQCHDGPAGCAADCANFGGAPSSRTWAAIRTGACRDPGTPCFDASQCNGWSCDAWIPATTWTSPRPASARSA